MQYDIMLISMMSLLERLHHDPEKRRAPTASTLRTSLRRSYRSIPTTDMHGYTVEYTWVRTTLVPHRDICQCAQVCRVGEPVDRLKVNEQRHELMLTLDTSFASIAFNPNDRLE